MNILLINTHLKYPNWSEGTLNAAMTDVAKKTLGDLGHRITQSHVEDGYDPATEVQKHVDADLVVLQTPINWFGAPWIYKKYVDEVFNYGLQHTILLNNDGRTRSDVTRQYGTGGLMQGKKFLIAVTWNAPTATFSNQDSVMFEGLSVDEVLTPISANYKFTGFEILPTFGLYDIFREDSDITGGLMRYGKYLNDLTHSQEESVLV